MTLICLHRDILGEDVHLVFDDAAGTYAWRTELPVDAWIYGDAHAPHSLDAFMSLSGLSVSDPFARHRTAFRALGHEGPIRWRHVLPQDALTSSMHGMLDDLKNALDMGCVAYYLDVFQATRRCLGALERACVDGARLDQHMDDELNPTNRAALWSFEPDASGFSNPVVYDQLATVTGRLTVTSGPRILTLAKRHRDIIVSRYAGGSILMLDFRSLEPRVLLLSSGQPAADDIYDDINEKMLGSRIAREKVKGATIALLYGASEATAERLVGVHGSELFDLLEHVRTYFDLRGLEERLERQMDLGCLKNGYGRPICPAAGAERKLVNLFAQSTAVDAAMLGFARGMDLITKMGWKMHPLFIIHDALILDAHPDALEYIRHVEEACASDTMLGHLPVSTKEIRCVAD